MQDIRQRIEQIAERFEALKKVLDPKKLKEEHIKLEAKSTDPDLWKDPEAAKRLLRELSDFKNQIEELESLGEEIEVLSELATHEETDELAEEVDKSEKKLEKLELASFLSGAYDKKNALVSIHAGQGGTEAMDWASMLFRMYKRFVERRNWEMKVLDLTSGEEAGIKSVTFAISGQYAYGYLKGEAGTHRLVRQSPFNADKLRQTSFALVEVLPELSEVDLPDIEIKDEDLDWQFFRSSSQGGQNVQKVSTAVRVIHKPTGIVVSAQAQRAQEQNRKIALGLLRAKLWVYERQKEKETKDKLKGEYRPASWGNQIRSYVLHPYKMVKDLRTQVETSNTEAVLDGEIDEFIEAELKLVS